MLITFNRFGLEFRDIAIVPVLPLLLNESLHAMINFKTRVTAICVVDASPAGENMNAIPLETNLIANNISRTYPALHSLRIAIVHEWITTYGGSEQVLEQLISLFPGADIYCVVNFLTSDQAPFLSGRLPRTSWIQKLPFARKHARKWIWLMPMAIEDFDLSSYDLIISSSHGVAKGVITGPSQLHICYCHTPIRYAWDMQHQYLRQAGLERGLKGAWAKVMLHYIRLWDLRTANGVDHFVANSHFVSKRIQKVYRRASSVVHPPVNVDAFGLECQKERYYLAASRLVPYKRMDLIVEAFSKMPERKLIVIGDGPEMARCRAKASPNVTLLGYQSFDSLRHWMQRAKAFLFAAEEDFGIIVVEAQACGTPVICLGRGGATDTVIPGETGLFFNEQSPEALCEAVEQFESGATFDPLVIRSNAKRFDRAQFRKNFLMVANQRWLEHCQ